MLTNPTLLCSNPDRRAIALALAAAAVPQTAPLHARQCLDASPVAVPSTANQMAAMTDSSTSTYNTVAGRTPSFPSASLASTADHRLHKSVPAPTTNGTASSALLNPRSCVTCRKRKVRCDKLHPCNNCSKAHIECVFPSPGRAPRKARKPPDSELLARLRRLEGVVKSLGVRVEDSEVQEHTGLVEQRSPDQRDVGRALEGAGLPRRADQEQGIDPYSNLPRQTLGPPAAYSVDEWVEENAKGKFENRFGRLVVDERSSRSRYVNNSFWASLSNEVEDLKGILNDSSDNEAEEQSSPSSNIHIPAHHQGWIFSFSSQNVDMLALHPAASQIPIYWQVFIDNVDPLVKVLHIPSATPTILTADPYLSSLPKGLEALMFAIYYAAVTSLTPVDCLAKFHDEKSVLLIRYRFAIEQALARASFLTTEETIVLQALVIFLICLRRNSDARVIWTLTGLVVRIAQTIGLHRDGSHFGLSPFEIERRRRLWWQVCILDTRASEDHGCDPTITEQSFDTKMPLNVNDEDLSPSMREFPPARQGCTDMTFCIIRFEVSNTFRRINYIPPSPLGCNNFFATVSLEDKERWITECHARLEERYLKHCDMSIPLYWVTATVARLMMAKMWLMVYHPFQRQDGGASLPQATKDKLFITSLENVEYSLLLETEARTMRWGWLFRTYVQWHALAFLLSELCVRIKGDIVERAWVAVEKTCEVRLGERDSAGAFTDVGADSDHNDRKSHLWKPLRKLMAKARAAREKEPAAEREAEAERVRRLSESQRKVYNEAITSHPPFVRAPLSQAQLGRLGGKLRFGSQPLNATELLKSPVVGVSVRSNDVMVDINMLPSLSRQTSQNSQHQQEQQQQQQQQQQRILSQDQAMDFDWHSKDDIAGSFGRLDHHNTSPNLTFNTTSNMANNTFDPNKPSLGAGRTSDGNSDALNWAIWDDMVRQFGMDADMAPEAMQGMETGSWGGAQGAGSQGGYGLGFTGGSSNAKFGMENWW